jgi:hypothetical protein
MASAITNHRQEGNRSQQSARLIFWVSIRALFIERMEAITADQKGN